MLKLISLSSQGIIIFHNLNRVLYYHYEAPPGFNFDVGVNEDPIMFDNSLEYYNLE